MVLQEANKTKCGFDSLNFICRCSFLFLLEAKNSLETHVRGQLLHDAGVFVGGGVLAEPAGEGGEVRHVASHELAWDHTGIDGLQRNTPIKLLQEQT